MNQRQLGSCGIKSVLALWSLPVVLRWLTQ
uniref:Uncharacterized protein n=1 Tax=Anguilla anguilla TaxID=7936 RepID=A0A0E9QAT2_ANGAN